jgi:hypothetical protein
MPRTDKASRVIAAPPARVYAAFADQDALLTYDDPMHATVRPPRTPTSSTRVKSMSFRMYKWYTSSLANLADHVEQ